MKAKRGRVPAPHWNSRSDSKYSPLSLVWDSKRGVQPLFLAQIEGPGSSLRTTHDDQDMAFPAEVESAAGAETEKLMPTVETLEWPLEAMERIEDSCRKRGHATGWHAPNEFQNQMEVGATREWALEMNKRGWKIDIHTIRKNSETYPDCTAEMDGEKIGVEVTELVDGNVIKEHPENPRYEGPEQFVREFSVPMPPEWPIEKFEQHLRKLVCHKNERVKDSSLSKQFLLIVTDEPWLDKATLAEYLRTIKLQRPRHFDSVFVMTSYVPNPAGRGDGHYPVVGVPFSN